MPPFVQVPFIGWPELLVVCLFMLTTLDLFLLFFFCSISTQLLGQLDAFMPPGAPWHQRKRIGLCLWRLSHWILSYENLDLRCHFKLLYLVMMGWNDGWTCQCPLLLERCLNLVNVCTYRCKVSELLIWWEVDNCDGWSIISCLVNG